uniref:Putative ovule protein n=1 Tax=Solanum chacoense TaxID=4108 RepID=A0A0V0GYP7_SOLCH
MEQTLKANHEKKLNFVLYTFEASTSDQVEENIQFLTKSMMQMKMKEIIPVHYFHNLRAIIIDNFF